MKALKHTLVAAFMLLLFLPAAVTYLPLKAPALHRKVAGEYIRPEKPRWSWANFRSEKYQDSLSRYEENTNALRPFLLPCWQQLNYSLLGRLPKDQIAGANDYHFFDTYMNAFLFDLPDQVALEKTSYPAILELQRYVSAHHIPMVYIIAPGKASYNSDQLPKHWLRLKQPVNSYDHLRDFLQQNHVPTFDAHAWFGSMKTTTPYPLYPKHGTHWSAFGAALVADSLSRQLAAMLALPGVELELKKVDRTVTARGSDWDMEELQNLWFRTHADTLGYPEYVVKKEGNRPKVLLIGDSYCCTFSLSGIDRLLFDQDSRIWYYGSSEWKLNNEVIGDVKDKKTSLLQYDAVVFIATEINYFQGDFFVNSN